MATKITKNKNALTADLRLACLEIRSRNEEAINSTRNVIYSLKGFLLPTLSTSILFICFWIDLVRVLATTRNTFAVAGYTSLPEIKKVIYMARHFNHRRKLIACSSQEPLAYNESLQYPSIAVLLLNSDSFFFDHSAVFTCSKVINAFKR